MSVFHPSTFDLPVSAKQVREAHPGFTFGTFRDPPGKAWVDFVHDTDEYVVVVEGTVQITVGAETAACRPGNLVLIPAGASHTLRTSPDRSSIWHYGYGRFEADHG